MSGSWFILFFRWWGGGGAGDVRWEDGGEFFRDPTVRYARVDVIAHFFCFSSFSFLHLNLFVEAYYQILKKCSKLQNGVKYKISGRAQIFFNLKQNKKQADSDEQNITPPTTAKPCPPTCQRSRDQLHWTNVAFKLGWMLLPSMYS